MILGADVSWITQLEEQGYRWVDDTGVQVDPIQAAQNLGVNTVRLRIFVNPPASAYWEKPAINFKGHMMPGGWTMLGYCDKNSISKLAKRAKALGMDLMIDLHYSDHFADPVFQDIPAAWAQDTADELVQRVSDHTEDVLNTLKSAGVAPEYVQVGNELNMGLLLPVGSFHDAPDQMIRMLNAGYDAVKRCCPDTTVVTHISSGHDLHYIKLFFDVFFAKGGKTDMIGLSYYPYWFGIQHDFHEFLDTLSQTAACYGKPIVLSEIGERYDEPEKSYSLLADTLRVLEHVPDHQGVGMFYWEPEVSAEPLPDRYLLGAACLTGEKTLQYTKALRAYLDYTLPK